MTPQELVEEQMEAYNARDLERFCGCYCDDIRAYSLTDGKVMFEGMKTFREKYRELFAASPNLRSRIVNRMVLGDFVVDQEEVVGIMAGPLLRAIATYRVTGAKISHVWFVLAPG
jgi:hypothetical protein